MPSPLPDDLDLLVALDVFLRERHITRAARSLGITQGAASQRLGRLRAFFGDPILVAGRPLLIPTPRAQAIAEPLSRALAALRAAVRTGAPFDPKTTERQFVLLGNDLVEGYLLPWLLERIAREAPNVTLTVERTEADFAGRLERGTADAAFIPNFLVGESMRRLALPNERFVVILRRDHPFIRRVRGRAAIDLKDYLEVDHVLVAPRGAPGGIVDSALEKLGKQRRVVARVQHFVSAPFVVATTDLAVTCPATVFDAVKAFLPVVAVELPIAIPEDRTSLVWHERSQDDPGHIWLRKQVAAHVQEQPPRRGAARSRS